MQPVLVEKMNAPFVHLTLFFLEVTASRSSPKTKDRFLEQTENQATKQEASLCNLVPMFPVHFGNRRGDCPSVLRQGGTCSIPCNEESGGKMATITCHDGLLDIPDCSFGLTCDTAGIIHSVFDGHFGTCTDPMRVGTHCSTACPGNSSLNVRVSCHADGLTYPTCAAIEGGRIGRRENAGAGKSPVRTEPDDRFRATSDTWIIAIVIFIIVFPFLLFAACIFICAKRRKMNMRPRQERTKAMLAKKVDPSVTNSLETFGSSTMATVPETTNPTTQSRNSSLYGRDTIEPYGPIIPPIIITPAQPAKAMKDALNISQDSKKTENTKKSAFTMDLASTKEGVPPRVLPMGLGPKRDCTKEDVTAPVLPVGLGPGRDGVRLSSLRQESTDIFMVELVGRESGSGSGSEEQDYNMLERGRKKEQGVHPL